ncbi:preprotein translocase subunit SecG [Ancylobacter radicis]|uniref:Protein-export membrane protein SecG n=1 Tax=Ancylobacter radicis TaxID=2836179 RepID=A0ABS5R3T0_9HYPH|nr:preprotein translocase subunit SecG [Ancylobacter radicis]MBS9476318.1 preprotein translocase subunit SecG [Ancylobacter radicis]
MQTVLIVIHLMVVLALIGVVLIQRSEGGGLGIGGGGGGGGGFFSARGTANVLTRATAILAGLFFVTSLSLTVLAGWGRGPTTIFNAPATTAPGAPVPGGSVLDQLQGAQPAPSAPAAPAVPQVPQSQ